MRSVDASTQKVQSFDLLATFRNNSGEGTAELLVPVPDSRLRVKLSILFIPTSGVAISGLNGSIWLREADRDMSGVSGALIPCANIEGTAAAPTLFPGAGLQGYSREFVTAADFILGTVEFSDGGPSANGSWVFQCRYQPNNVRFTNDEWDKIAANCNPSVNVGPILL